jgi:hypothetical protein
MSVSVVKDKKGASYIVSHKRCGVTECIWLTLSELLELKDVIIGIEDGCKEDLVRRVT